MADLKNTLEKLISEAARNKAARISNQIGEEGMNMTEQEKKLKASVISKIDRCLEEISKAEATDRKKVIECRQKIYKDLVEELGVESGKQVYEKFFGRLTRIASKEEYIITR